MLTDTEIWAEHYAGLAKVEHELHVFASEQLKSNPEALAENIKLKEKYLATLSSKDETIVRKFLNL